MRHGAVTFAQQVAERAAQGAAWDVLFCSDMLNLAEFVGLSGAAVQALPRVVYFHENQLTYPVRHASERDYQFGMTNITTCLAADQVWFNSAFHRDSFLEAVEVFLKTDAGLPAFRRGRGHPGEELDSTAGGGRLCSA